MVRAVLAVGLARGRTPHAEAPHIDADELGVTHLRPTPLTAPASRLDLDAPAPPTHARRHAGPPLLPMRPPLRLRHRSSRRDIAHGVHDPVERHCRAYRTTEKDVAGRGKNG
jgi:hypothetical protein